MDVLIGSIVAAAIAIVVFATWRTRRRTPRRDSMPSPTQEPRVGEPSLGDPVPSTLAEPRLEIPPSVAKASPALAASETPPPFSCNGGVRHRVAELFAHGIPAIAEGRMRIEQVACIPGYKMKVAVAQDCADVCDDLECPDPERLQRIADEFPDVRIELVRWHSDVEQLICNSLQPLQIEQILLCDSVARAIVLVEDASLAAEHHREPFRLPEEARLAGAICGLEVDLMTNHALDRCLEDAAKAWKSLPGVDHRLAEQLIDAGCLYFRDLPRLGAERLCQLAMLTPQAAADLITQAEQQATLECAEPIQATT